MHCCREANVRGVCGGFVKRPAFAIHLSMGHDLCCLFTHTRTHARIHKGFRPLATPSPPPHIDTYSFHPQHTSLHGMLLLSDATSSCPAMPLDYTVPPLSAADFIATLKQTFAGSSPPCPRRCPRSHLLSPTLSLRCELTLGRGWRSAYSHPEHHDGRGRR